jgi:putative hemolysin
MTVTATIIGILVLLITPAMTSVLAAAETSVRSVPRIRTRRLSESGERAAVPFEALAERPSHLAAAHALSVVVGVAFTSAVLAWALDVVWAALPAWADAAIAAFATIVVVFSIGEALPRAIALANPEDSGLAAAPAALWLTRLLYPFARLLSAPWTRVTSLVAGERGAEVPWLERDEEHRFGMDEDQLAHEGEEEDMLEAVSGLHEKIVREVMVPRTDMVAIEDTATMEETLASITAAGVSRVPVFHDTIDDIRGVLYAKDLLSRIGAQGPPVRPADLARPALFVPETKPVEELLREMRRRTHIAIVADEYGGTSGLVTMEDLLEEIVGEIYDEYDPLVSLIAEFDDGHVRVDARLSVDDFDERFGTEFDVEADTVGGLFTELAGRIPAVGESVMVQGVRLTVDEMEGHRVRQLIVEPVSTPSEETRDE